MLLSHNKECTWVRSSEGDESEAYYTEWSKAEREKQISYVNAYIWTLERWYGWTYLQGRKRDSDVKNSLLDIVEEGEVGMIWESNTEI